MKPNQITLGIKFNRKMFRTQDLAGSIIDRILSDKKINKNHEYFTLVSNPIQTLDGDSGFTLNNPERLTELTVTYTQIIFKKHTTKYAPILNLESMLDEFSYLVRIIDQLIKLVETRRTGIVFNYTLMPNDEKLHNSISKIINVTNKENQLENVGLHFAETYHIDPKFKGTVNTEIDDCVNIIKTFNLQKDISGSNKTISASIDVQRFFNPAKINSIGSMRGMLDILRKHKEPFELILNSIGNQL